MPLQIPFSFATQRFRWCFCFFVFFTEDTFIVIRIAWILNEIIQCSLYTGRLIWRVHFKRLRPNIASTELNIVSICKLVLDTDLMQCSSACAYVCLCRRTLRLSQKPLFAFLSAATMHTKNRINVVAKCVRGYMCCCKKERQRGEEHVSRRLQYANGILAVQAASGSDNAFTCVLR